MRHPLAHTPLATVPHLINNFFYTVTTPDLSMHLEPDRPAAGDGELCERLISAFWAAHNAENERVDRPSEGVWEMVKHEFHGPAYKLLAAHDARGLSAYLSNGLRETIAYGLGAGPETLAALQNGNIENITLLRDRIVSLAVALGVLPIESPEQGHYGKNMSMSLRDIVSAVEDFIGVPLGRPPAMGNFGFAFNGAVIDYRAPEDAYAAYLLREYPSIAEIGGGFGGAAFQFSRAGHRVSVYDLPIMGVVQGYFLSRLLKKSVSLYGEPDQGGVRILPWFCFDSDASDIVFNRDSMAEFPKRSALQYLWTIKARGVPFVSINQEAQHESGQPGVRQLRVSELAHEAGLRRRSRSLYWIRRGYAEEFYNS